MDPPADSPVISRRPKGFALAGLILGFLGLALSTAEHVRVVNQPPDPKLAQKLGDFLREVKDKALKKGPPVPAGPAAPESPWKAILTWGASGCGFAGTVCGCISWLRHEERRYSWAALLVGFGALAWQQLFLLLVLSIALVVLLMVLFS